MVRAERWWSSPSSWLLARHDPVDELALEVGEDGVEPRPRGTRAHRARAVADEDPRLLDRRAVADLDGPLLRELREVRGGEVRTEFEGRACGLDERIGVSDEDALGHGPGEPPDGTVDLTSQDGEAVAGGSLTEASGLDEGERGHRRRAVLGDRGAEGMEAVGRLGGMGERERLQVEEARFGLRPPRVAVRPLLVPRRLPQPLRIRGPAE